MNRFALALLLALVAVACGDDDDGTASPANGSTENNGSTNATTNAGTNGATNGSTNGATNGSSNGETNNMSTNNAATNNAATNNAATNNAATNNAVCTELDPALGPCDPICQTGCDIGEHCITTGDPIAAECGPAGPGAQGQACNADTECAVGLHCRSFGGTNRRCTTYCAPDRSPTGCPPNHGCVRFAGEPRLGACIVIEHDCEAVPDDTCPDPEECYDTVTGRTCLPAGDRELDAPCIRSSDCMPGLRCVGVDGMGERCRPVCDPDGEDTCTDPATCHMLRDSNGETLSWGACY